MRNYCEQIGMKILGEIKRKAVTWSNELNQVCPTSFFRWTNFRLLEYPAALPKSLFMQSGEGLLFFSFWR